MIDLNLLFDPVSLTKPRIAYMPETERFCFHVDIHTENNPIRNIEKFKVAIIGVPENYGTINKGTVLAPDATREYLYQFSAIQQLSIVDLGNLKMTNDINNTLVALRDAIIELNDRGIISIVIGGSHILTRSFYDAFKVVNKKLKLSIFDAKLDVAPVENDLTADNFLYKIIEDNKMDHAIEELCCFAYQSYYTFPKQIEILNENHVYHERLGLVRGQVFSLEPEIRDSHAISLDLNCIRQNDFPANARPSINGLWAEDACQIAKYAGLSENTTVFGLFEHNPDYEVSYQSSHLAAQMVWIFLDSYTNRKLEPVSSLIQYHVPIGGNKKDQLIFYKSELTQRWWFAAPEESVSRALLSCSYDDYTKACNGEIPEKWWRILKKINNF